MRINSFFIIDIAGPFRYSPGHARIGVTLDRKGTLYYIKIGMASRHFSVSGLA